MLARIRASIAGFFTCGATDEASADAPVFPTSTLTSASSSVHTRATATPTSTFDGARLVTRGEGGGTGAWATRGEERGGTTSGARVSGGSGNCERARVASPGSTNASSGLTSVPAVPAARGGAITLLSRSANARTRSRPSTSECAAGHPTPSSAPRRKRPPPGRLVTCSGDRRSGDYDGTDAR